MDMKNLVAVLAGFVLFGFAIPPSKQPGPPRVFAHYMPWFRAEKSDSGMVWDHWQWYGKGKKHDPDTVLENGHRDIASVYYPLIGPYDGRDPAVLEYHMLTAKAAGIDGFIADWYGPDGYTDTVFTEMVKAAERYGMKVAICLEEKTFFNGAKVRGDGLDTMERQIRYVLDHHARSPAYLRVNGAPVFLIFDSYGSGALGPSNLSPQEFRDVQSRFTNQILLARGHYEEPYLGAVDAFYGWCGDAQYRRDFYEKAKAAHETHQLKSVIGGASPGFDDSGVNGWGNGARFTDRRGTKEYEESWADILKYRPEAVQIVTWNDFQEGTTIEPSEQYGFSFLDLTEQFVQQFTGREANLGDNTWPFHVYRLRQQVAAIADAAVRTEWTGKLDKFSEDFSNGKRFMMSWRLKRLESGVRDAAGGTS